MLHITKDTIDVDQIYPEWNRGGFEPILVVRDRQLRVEYRSSCGHTRATGSCRSRTSPIGDEPPVESPDQFQEQTFAADSNRVENMLMKLRFNRKAEREG